MRQSNLGRWLAIPGRSALALFALIALLLTGSALLVMETIEAERAERQQVTKTTRILVELRNVGRAAINAETGQRGYFITLDQRYLAPYEVGREQFPLSLQNLRQTFGPDISPEQERLLNEIEQLTRSKFAEMRESVGMIERGELIAAQRMILTDQGQETMNRLRRALFDMETMEQNILRDAAERSRAAEERVMPLLAILIVLISITLALGLFQTTRAARADAAEAQALALAEAHERADLLARELAHRVRNLFAMILAIVNMSARNEPDETRVVTERIAERIRALLTVQEVTQGANSRPVGDLRTLVEMTLAPYRDDTSACVIDGVDLSLPDTTITPLGLVLHELATNAVKYGAWSAQGEIRVSWRNDERAGEVTLDWVEMTSNPAKPGDREGFGSMLMKASARQLRGSIERRFTPEGLIVTILFPTDAHAA
ncbi:MAG: CHASE3 domain-containing protein [Novosphingobium sp.]